MRALNTLRVILVVAVAVSIVHYADNTVRFEDYASPDPSWVSSWIKVWTIPVAWVAFTAAGIVGYRRFAAGRISASAPWLGAYAGSGLIGPLHFVDVAPSRFDAFQLTFVLLDIACGIAVLAFAVWAATQSSNATSRLLATSR